MRVLFSTTGNDGHFGPLVPLGRATAAAGHQVRVAAPRSYAAAIERAGFVPAPFDDPPPEVVAPVMARLPALSFEEANATVIQEVFGRIDAQAARPALSLEIESWEPHLVVREPAELGSLAAAERAGVPHCAVAIGMTEIVREFAAMVTDPLLQLARTVGLPEEALVHAVTAEPLLSSVPESLDRAGDAGYSADAVTFRYRAETPTAGVGALPTAGALELPLVYVTFGSVTGSFGPLAGVFREALDGLAELPIRVFMTVGRQVDVAGLGPLPPNARVVNWWPQAEALAEASVVVGHGGFGTTMGAVAAGVPQVVAPLFSTDQVVNARHVASAGAGRRAEPGSDVVTQACREVPVLLTGDDYRSSAQRLALDAAALPPVTDAVATLEQLAG